MGASETSTDKDNDAGNGNDLREEADGGRDRGRERLRDAEAGQARFADLGEIAAEVAHELRNALQVIRANAFIARQDIPKCERNLAQIERSARLAHQIVDDLMTLARGECGAQEPVLVADLLSAAREDLPEAAATYLDRFDPANLTVFAHVGLLARCLHALYDNAQRASSPRAPRIETRAWIADGCAVIEIADDGPGIPPAMASSLFEPFVTGRPGGTGLGLALAKRMAIAHDGSLVLVPSATGAGATFRIAWPLPTFDALSLARASLDR